MDSEFDYRVVFFTFDKSTLSLSRILALIFENVLEILSFQITNR